MAECQTPYCYTSTSDELKKSLSENRFLPYLKKAGYDNSYAFNLYLYNARLSKAFLYPLHILEVCLRNRISAVLEEDFGESWPLAQSFRSILSKESLANLEKATERSKSHSTGDIVSTLTFDFWSNLFRAEYDRSLWQTRINKLLPNTNKTRKEFQGVVKEINKFRNRVAHHEPIHNLNTQEQYQKILEVISWICQTTKDWTKSHSTINSVLRTSPSSSGEPKPHFGDRCDKSYKKLRYDDSLTDIGDEKFFICLNDKDQISAVLQKEQFFDYLYSLREEDGTALFLDLSELKVQKVLESLNIRSNFSICGASESLQKAKLLFKTSPISYLLVYEADVLKGVISKSHRQY
ncbi:MAG: Abi family protein [Alteromonas macleodii]